MRLIVYRNDELIREISLGDKTVVSPGGEIDYFIGRAEDCHLQLDDQQVSRYHAVIRHTVLQWEVRKFTKTSSLLVNNQSCETKILTNGDLIAVGPFQIKIEGLAASSGTKATTLKEFRPPDTVNEIVEEVIPSIDPEVITETLTEAPTFADDEVGHVGNIGEEVSSEEKSEFSQDGLGEEFSISADGSSEEMMGAPLPVNEFADSGGDQQTQMVSAFAQYRLKLFGELAPYDHYLLQEGDTFIGRHTEKCQILLNDDEVSAIHAVIHKKNTEIWLEDLNSSNGTIHNGSRVNKAKLQSLDEFVIGSTTFTLEVQSDLILSEKDRLMPVEENQVVEVEEVVEETVDFGEDLQQEGTGSKSLFSKDALSNPQKRKKLIYIVVGLLLLVFFLFDEEPKKEGTGEKKAGDVKVSAPQEGTPTADSKTAKKRRELTPEEEEYVKAAYNKARDLYEQGLYSEAEIEINKVFSVSDYQYKEAEQLRALIAEGYRRLKEEEERKQKEEEELKRKKMVEELLVKAKDAVEKKNEILAQGLFTKILELDPEQPDVGLLKMELEAWRKEQDRLKTEAAMREGYQNSKDKKFSEAKGPYLQKSWFVSINSLEKFLNTFDSDRDPGLDQIMTPELSAHLKEIKESAAKMLEESRDELKTAVEPLIKEAHSLKEGQDLKGAYETYLKILDIWPSHEEALGEVLLIRETLDLKVGRVYREALISESLSLFKDAEEKFQEVLQVAPSDSRYYLLAKEKLKRYVK